MIGWGPGTGLYAEGRRRGPRRNPHAPARDGIKRLLVLNFGQLGDTILSLPALDVLRDHYPDAELTIGSGMPAHELHALWGRADRIFAMDRVKARDANPLYGFALVCQWISGVRSPTPDAVVVMHPIAEINLIAAAMRVRRRAGLVARKGFFASLLNEPLEDIWKTCHASAAYLALAHRFCGLPPPDLARPPIPAVPLERAPTRNGRIAIHLGAGRKERRIAPEVWREVALGLREASGKEIAFVTGPEERGVGEQLVNEVRGASLLSGMNIEQLARELAASGFFVGADSGPGHLAASLSTPVLTVIERHIEPRYRTLGPTALTLSHRGVREVTPGQIVDAVLNHPAFKLRAS